MEIAVRHARPFEAALVAEILTEAALWLEEQQMPMWLQNELATSNISPDVESGYYFLGWAGVTALGTMRLTPTDSMFWPDAKIGEALYLHRLTVRRSAAGGNVSTALLRWALNHAASRGARYLRLDCVASRHRLRLFYERHGFAFHSEYTTGQYHVARYQLPCAHAV